MIELPRVIDMRYRIDRHVAQGGFGSVYAGEHLALGVPVAVKVLDLGRHAEPSRIAEITARFLEEARVLTRLRHPNIVAALDLGLLSIAPDVDAPYLVLEWAYGVTLERALEARGAPLSIEEAWALFEPILEAVACAHEAHVVHRDLKPSNIMIEPGTKGIGVPRLIDFGIAKIVAPDEEPGTGMTETAEPTGAFTPAYAAPEQITRSRTGPWTDVHALGLLFVELVTGRAPYGSGEGSRLAVVDPERPTPLARGVDAGALEAVIARAVQLRPRERYAHAGEMLDAAREAARGIAAPSTKPRTASSARPPSSRPESEGPIVVRGRRASAAAPVARTLPTGHEPPRPRAPEWPRRALIAGGIVAIAGLVVTLALPRRAPPPPHAPPATTARATSVDAFGHTWHVQQGDWRVEGSELVGSGGQVYSEASFGDALIELDFEPIHRGRAAHAVGIGFRARPVADPAEGSGYGANFHAAGGTFNVFKGTEGEWHGVDPAFPTYHPTPALTSGKNHVAIRAVGSSFEIDVNDQRIASFTDNAFPRGRITLWAESAAQTVRFSALRVTPR